MTLKSLALSATVMLLTLGVMVSLPVAADPPSSEGTENVEPPTSKDLPPIPESELAEMRATYLGPLLELVGDEAAFVEKMEHMGDEEIVRLEELEDIFRFGHPPREEVEGLRLEVRERLNRLSWLCETSLAHFSENARVRNFRGNVFYDRFGRQVDGVKEWHMAVMLDDAYGDPHNNLGMHYFHVGRYPLGFKHMDRALELEPNNPDFCFNMAQNYLIFGPEVEKKRGWRQKKIYKEAMKLSKRAVEHAPDDYQLLEDYAVNFLAAQNFDVKADWKDAARAWQAAREHAPDDTKRFYTWLNEARAWIKKGDEDDARRCLEEALKIIPRSEIAQRLLDNLNEDA